MAPQKHGSIKLALYINYFVFAILLNSVGIVIKQSLNNYGVTETQASILEAFKDLPIAIVSFLVASFLPKFGYKNSMLLGLAMVFCACLYMYFGNSFDSAKVLFATIGVSFALIKVSVYSMIGLFTKTKEEHSSFMSSIEGFFMVGIASAYFLFPAFFQATIRMPGCASICCWPHWWDWPFCCCSFPGWACRCPCTKKPA